MYKYMYFVCLQNSVVWHCNCARHRHYRRCCRVSCRRRVVCFYFIQLQPTHLLHTLRNRPTEGGGTPIPTPPRSPPEHQPYSTIYSMAGTTKQHQRAQHESQERPPVQNTHRHTTRGAYNRWIWCCRFGWLDLEGRRGDGELSCGLPAAASRATHANADGTLHTRALCHSKAGATSNNDEASAAVVKCCCCCNIYVYTHT